MKPDEREIELEKLLEPLRERGLVLEERGSTNRMIGHLADDSRRVGPDGLFVAISGAVSDGHVFIDKAVQNGATAIMCETVPEDYSSSGTSCTVVSDTRAALAMLASTWHDHPSRRLRMVGVTGTNGKTTTSYLIYQALMNAGHQTGLLGTIETRIGEKVIPSELTTPGPLQLHALLAQMAEAGCSHCIMEASSHAIDQKRVAEIDFEVAVFTNLTQDHFDYHGSYDNYLAAKKQLFDHLSANASAVVNADDPAASEMVVDSHATVFGYGTLDNASVTFRIRSSSIAGLDLVLDGDTVSLGIPGDFNAYNATAAYTALTRLGFTRDEARQMVGRTAAARGRFEPLVFEDGTTVLIDYAHTPDALKNVLATINNIRTDSQSIWCIFGCGGDRDAAKRPLMGEIAQQGADFAIVTSDNPRTEPPQDIIDDVLAGMKMDDSVLIEPDRRRAIKLAAEKANPGDIVLIAGKGHETYQVLGTEKIHLDDREEALTSFNNRNHSA